MTPPVEGLLVLDKPPGPTSHDAVAAVRRLFGTRKVGHAGTLDPAASGVLVLALGQATRLLEYVTGCDKAYTGEVVLGVTTDSYDDHGAVVARHDASGLTEAEVERALATFRGALRQVPPMASAKKVDGQRLHELHRAGRTIEREPVPVTVHALTLTGFEPGAEAVASIACEVSAGTYIRSLAHDLGQALGVGGHLRGLRRTRVGPHTAADAVSLDTLEAMAPEERWRLLAPAGAAVAHLPRVVVRPAALRDLIHGRRVAAAHLAGPWPADDGPVAVLDPAGQLLAIGERRDQDLQPRKVLVRWPDATLRAPADADAPTDAPAEATSDETGATA